MCDIKIFVTVGTSFAKGQKGIIEEGHIKGILGKLSQKHIQITFAARANKGDPFPAEISSLYKFSNERDNELNSKKVQVYLLHSSGDGKYCAQGVKSLIRSKVNSLWGVKLKEIRDLDPRDGSKFSKAMDDLFTFIRQEISGFNGKVYLNITGGYKATLPFMVMIGLSLANVETFYLFEESTELIWLPAYPISFDLLHWRDERTRLLPFDYSGFEKEALFKSMQGTKFKDLVEKVTINGKVDYQLKPLAKFMKGLYEEQNVGKVISEYGAGEILLNRFSDSKWAIYLRQCIEKWRYISMGDRIPETVEHGRGHTQRLLEIAQQIIIAADKNITLTNGQFFVLIASIWLHDIGHSGDYFVFEGDQGVIQDKNDPQSMEPYVVYADPEKVRKYHNFMSYQILKEEEGFLFPAEGRPENGSEFKKILRSIQLACLYHRKEMPVDNEKEYKAVKVKKGLANFSTSTEVIEGFPLIASLLRFCDGAENQTERTVDENYYKVLDNLIQRQVNFLARHHPSGYDKLIAFKQAQPKHFEKHRLIKHIFITKDAGLKTIFIDQGSSKNTSDNITKYKTFNTIFIGVYFVIKKGDFENCEKLETIRNELVLDVYKEYHYVRKYFEFAINLHLILLDINNVQSEMKTIVKVIEKKEGTWDWELNS